MAAKIIFLILLASIIGLSAAVFSGRLGAPPGKRRPKPNTWKKGYKQYAIPVVGSIIICVLAWAGLSLLFSDNEAEKSNIQNAVSSSINENGDSPESSLRNSSFGYTGSSGRLVAVSPVAKAALRFLPVSSNVDEAGSIFAEQHAPYVSSSVEKDANKTNTEKIAIRNPAEQPVVSPAQVPTQKPTAKPADKPADKPSAPPEPTPPPESAKSKPDQGGIQFTVHLASFSEKNNADRSLAKLKSAGVPAFVSMTEVNSKIWYRLMVGRFANREEAEKYGRKIEEKGLNSGMGKYIIKPIDSENKAG